MRQQEGVNLQQGMNFDVRGGAVILMTRSALGLGGPGGLYGGAKFWLNFCPPEMT